MQTNKWTDGHLIFVFVFLSHETRNKSSNNVGNNKGKSVIKRTVVGALRLSIVAVVDCVEQVITLLGLSCVIFTYRVSLIFL